MAAATHRERVRTALRHQEPDRIPLDMMGNASMLLDRTYHRLREHLGLSPIPPIRSGTNANYYDERVLEYFDIDFRRIFLREKRPLERSMSEDGSFQDAWGVRYKREGPFVNVVQSPLSHVKTVQDVDAYLWPKAEEMFSADGLAERAQRAYEETDYALVARNPFGKGFLDRAQELMGTSEFLVTLALNPEVAQAIIAHLLEIYEQVYAMFLDAVGPDVQMVEVGDDLGYQQSLLISPALYRQFIRPAERKLYALIHEKSPGAALFRHADGAIFPLIPDLIEVGVDVLNPIQTSVRGMDACRLKEEYGDALTFHGGIEKMEASVGELTAEVKARIDVLAPGGGYVLASCNHMIDVQPENIIAMFDTAREYGRYGS